jgi:adenosylhomocysteine nucleosidase
MDTADAILAIAAERAEFAGLLAHASGVTPLGWPVAFSCSARIGGRPWLLAANGPGPKLAGEAVRTGLERVRPAMVLSTGLCGALDESLAVGDVFVATRVDAPEMDREFVCRTVDGAPRGALVSLDRVAVTSSEKARLRRDTGASAVEMEAAAVAGAAESAGAVFYCIRSVSDDARASFPLDFNRCRDAEGRFSIARIVAAAVRRPTAFPALLRLRSDAARASISLGDFLADCRF